MTLRNRLKELAARAQGGKPPAGESERRRGKRVKLPIPVQVRTAGAGFQEGRLVDASLVGLFVETAATHAARGAAAVRFEGYPEICGAFLLLGRVVRGTDDRPPGIGIEIDREASSPDALEQYRKLVLHYLHHRPLLDDLGRGYLEARCPACGWIGRVGMGSMTCSRCGERVQPVAADQR